MEEAYFNRDLASVRIVENTIAQIKKWRICADRLRWQGSLTDATKLAIWSVVRMFVNTFTKPLRDDKNSH
jgi:hypothetical protein